MENRCLAFSEKQWINDDIWKGLVTDRLYQQELSKSFQNDRIFLNGERNYYPISSNKLQTFFRTSVIEFRMNGGNFL